MTLFIAILVFTRVCMQVAKAWQPSVVYIGDCERTWMKKVPKTDKVAFLPVTLPSTSLLFSCSGY